MSAARHLVAELEGMGVRLTRGSRGPSLAGDLGKLTPAHLEGLKAHRKELEALTLWRALQDESEAKFGHPAARLYPFAANPSWEWWKAPLIRTTAGAAHLVQVLPHAVRVVKASEVRKWHEEQELQEKRFPFPGETLLLPLAEVWPPKAAPLRFTDTPQKSAEPNKNQQNQSEEPAR